MTGFDPSEDTAALITRSLPESGAAIHMQVQDCIMQVLS
jgi:hypothetical protein